MESFMKNNGKLESTFWALRLGLGATAFLAGADKFTNLLTNWEKYLAPDAKRKFPIRRKSFIDIWKRLEHPATVSTRPCGLSARGNGSTSITPLRKRVKLPGEQ